MWLFIFLFSLSSWASFPSDYESSRARFRQQSLGEKGYFKVPSQVDDDLTIDYFYLPPKEEKRNLLILSSGVHGVEAFAGSAIQSIAIKEKWFEGHPHLGLLFIHSVNPYGFKYLRRVSENNVDLNRNFDKERTLFAFRNEGYTKLTGLLNPKEKASFSGLSYYFSFAEMIYLILKESTKVLRQAILQGQYQYPKGLYFGGQDFEPQKKLLEPLLLDKMGQYEKILAIDLHTGYGENGKLHLFGPTRPEKKIADGIAKIFAGYKVDTGSDKDFYTTYGDFVSYLGQLTSDDQTYIPMTFEFGTVDNHTSLGGLKSLSQMILENQGHHHGFASRKDKSISRKQIQKMYYPDSATWRQKVLEQSREIFPKILRRLAED